VARREGRLPLINCGGLLPPAASAPPPAAGTQGEARLPIESLRLSQKGLDFIKGWEKCSLKPYDDSEGFCTIGWGHLIARKKCASLSKDELKPFTDGISQASADTMFSKDLEKQEDIVKEYVQVPLFQHEYDALVSLIFNLGGFKKCPKLLSKLNTKDYSGCCDEFADITNGGTSGLVKRRKAEMNIFRNAVYDSSH
jgi:GH24 family phage-related lysozyme (muramidase)